MAKLNCWQVKRCGRQAGGEKVKELGVCPAATARSFHGVHGGLNAGRACWVVAGTLCGGKVQGTFAAKLPNCMTCEFYLQVKEEEGATFAAASKILSAAAKPQ